MAGTAPMAEGPQVLSLAADLTAPTIEAATRRVMQAARDSAGFPSIPRWAADPGLGGEAPPGPGAIPAGTRAVKLALPTREGRALILRQASGPNNFLLDASLIVQGLGLPAIRAVLAGAVTLCRALAADGTMVTAGLTRLDGGHCLPVVPLADDATHAVLVSAAEIERGYEDPAAFRAAWDGVEDVGGLLLCTRALDAVGNPGFLRHVVDRHMAMARAARPGLVTLQPPRFAPGEFDTLDAAEPTLRGVGYLPAQQVYEFAGHTPPGAAVSCIDLLNANGIVTDGAVAGGGPVREVRAVFMDQEQATRSARLLQAAGVAVYWQQADSLQRVADGA